MATRDAVLPPGPSPAPAVCLLAADLPKIPGLGWVHCAPSVHLLPRSLGSGEELGAPGPAGGAGMGPCCLYSMLYFPRRVTPGVVCQGLLHFSPASEMVLYPFPAVLSLSGGMRWALTCGPAVGCSLLFGRHRETKAQCGTQRCMGGLRDVNTLSPVPSGGFCLPSPSLVTHHPLGHTRCWLREQWGRGHTDSPCPSVGPFLHPQLSVHLEGSQFWLLWSPGVPESPRLARGRGQRAVPVLGRAPSGFQLTNARRWLPAEELLLRRRLFTAC